MQAGFEVVGQPLSDASRASEEAPEGAALADASGSAPNAAAPAGSVIAFPGGQGGQRGASGSRKHKKHRRGH